MKLSTAQAIVESMGIRNRQPERFYVSIADYVSFDINVLLSLLAKLCSVGPQIYIFDIIAYEAELRWYLVNELRIKTVKNLEAEIIKTYPLKICLSLSTSQID